MKQEPLTNEQLERVDYILDHVVNDLYDIERACVEIYVAFDLLRYELNEMRIILGLSEWPKNLGSPS